jgi:hypothetical protein
MAILISIFLLVWRNWTFCFFLSQKSFWTCATGIYFVSGMQEFAKNRNTWSLTRVE